MSRTSDRDPTRWRDVPPSASGLEAEIGAASRGVTDGARPDELRVAHLRQRALQRAEGLGLSGRGGQWQRGTRLGWARTAAIIVVSLLVGGVATAVTGRLIQRYRAAKAPPATARVDHAATAMHPRRWRLSVKQPTDVDVSVGPDGAEVAVVGGQASLSGAGITGAVDVVPGKSWREGGEVLPPAPTPASAVPAPSARPAQTTLAMLEAPSARRKPPAESPRAAPEPPRGSPVPALPPPIVIQAPRVSLVEPPPLAPPPLPLRLPSPVAGAGGTPAERARPLSPKPAGIGEATLLARALGRLRRDHDPMWALQDLDEHRRRFPLGELRHEAALARAEALLAMDRKAGALVVLDGLRLEGGPTERSAALARAELRAEEGRRSEAIGDFDRVIAGGGDDGLAERALFGRGLCHLRGGDLGGARADLRTHLDRFPDSARRAEVEKLIDRLEN